METELLQKTATFIKLLCTYTIASTNKPWFETELSSTLIIKEQILPILKQKAEASSLISCFSRPGSRRTTQTNPTPQPTATRTRTEDRQAIQETGPEFGRPHITLMRLGMYDCKISSN